MVDTLKRIWLSVRYNPVFVVFEGAFIGALGKSFGDELLNGHIDLSRQGIERLIISAAGLGYVAVLNLKRPQPGSNPNQ
jgi:hypothetical protein